MNGRTRGIGLAGALAALVLQVGPAAAQYTLKGIAGRGIGDGRQATAAALDTPAGVAFDADGALLIADADHSRIRRVDPSTGVITTMVGTISGSLGDTFPPTGVQMKSPWRVLRTPAGDLLIAEKGGARVRRVRHDTGNVDTLAGTGSAGYGGDGGPANAATLNQPQDVAVDSVGNVYIADFQNHAIRMVNTGGVISTIAGNGAPGFTGDGGPAAAAQLAYPACVLIAPGDVLYVCDKGNHVIRRISAGIITTVAGVPGSGGFNGDGPATTQQLFEPEDLALAPDGSLVLADARNDRVRRIVVGGNITTLAGTGASAYAGENVPAASSPLAAPFGVAVRNDGTVLIAERDAERVRAIQGGALVTVAGDGVAGFGGDGGPAADATFDDPKGMALDAQGNLYLTDSANDRIRKVDTNGIVSTIAGNGTTTFGVDDVPATVVGLDGPSDVVVDGQGDVVFSDTNHHRIRFVDPAGNIHTLVGTGEPTFGADGQPAAQTAIQHPTGLAWDPQGNLVFADFGNDRVRRVRSDGTVETLAGNGQQGFAGDGGPALAASLYNPVDMAFDAQGNLFIADFRNQRVRRVDAATGVITTIAGNGTAAGSADFQPATLATLNGPTDVAVDAAGNVLVVDSNSNRIRRVTPQGVIDTVAGQRTPGDGGDDGPATSGLLLNPLRVLLVGGRAYIADHGNGRIRAIDGPVEPPYTVSGHIPGGSGGAGAGGGGGGNAGCLGSQANCVAGGGPKKTDCWLEFEVESTPHGLRVSCTDGDPSCDHDQTPGQCTFEVTPCLNVSDGRNRRCAAGPLASVTVMRPTGAAGEGLARALSTATAGQVVAAGRSTVTFATAVTRATCGGKAAIVVPQRGRRAGKVALVAQAKAAKGKDKDRVVLVCNRKR